MDSQLPSIDKRNYVVAALIFFVITIILCCFYKTGLGASNYIIDDQSLINIPQLKIESFLDFLKSIFYFPQHHIDYYPLRDISYWIDIHVFGANTNPGDSLIVFRIHNFLIFYFIGLLVFKLMVELDLHSKFNIFLLLIWFLHPYHVEMLMWVSARKDLLGILCSLLFIIAYIKAIKKNSTVLFILCFVSLIFTGMSKHIIAPLVALISIRWLLDQNIYYKTKLADAFNALFLVMSMGLAAWANYFYSFINDMRFNYSMSYRLKGSLAALGRMTVGWLNPQVNAIDVFNWGSWADRNINYIPVGILFFVIIFSILTNQLRKQDKTSAYLILLFFASYLPISGLLFPHRNFYSTRYFEFPSLILLFLIMKKSPLIIRYFTFSKGIKISISVLILCILTWAQFNESKNWENSISTIKKALRLDPTNSSLLAELNVSEGIKGLLPECQNLLEKPSAISMNGDLCWFNIQSNYNLLNPTQTVYQTWLLEHAKKNSDHFYDISKDYFRFANAINQTNSNQVNLESFHSGFLNNEFNRVLYLANICLTKNTPSLHMWKNHFFENELVDPRNIFSFINLTPKNSQPLLKKCFPDDIRENFLSRVWLKTINLKLNNNYLQWWLDSVRNGAPGRRYGCGNNHINGYDCGSTMDQASMINLYVELYSKTKEEGFLKEAFHYASNGNQMCSIFKVSQRTCGDGKAQGTWILSLLKLFLSTTDFKLRQHLIGQLSITAKNQNIKDIWDYYEIYRSYYLGFKILPEARQENFLDQINEYVLQKGITTKDQIYKITGILECTYDKSCVNFKKYYATEIGQSIVESSLRELAKMQVLNNDIIDKLNSQDRTSDEIPIKKARILLSRCDEENYENSSSQASLLDRYIHQQFNEDAKPFYYSEEGDNFAPTLLVGFNYLFSKKLNCTQWEIPQKNIYPVPRLKNYFNSANFSEKRRPIFLLPQINLISKKLRLWIVNNEKKIISISLKKKSSKDLCDLSLPRIIQIDALNEKQIFLDLPAKFNLDLMKKCIYEDENKRIYPLYP